VQSRSEIHAGHPNHISVTTVTLGTIPFILDLSSIQKSWSPRNLTVLECFAAIDVDQVRAVMPTNPGSILTAAASTDPLHHANQSLLTRSDDTRPGSAAVDSVPPTGATSMDPSSTG
jgi:hypothetical protein